MEKLVKIAIKNGINRGTTSEKTDSGGVEKRVDIDERRECPVHTKILRRGAMTPKPSPMTIRACFSFSSMALGLFHRQMKWQEKGKQNSGNEARQGKAMPSEASSPTQKHHNRPEVR